MSSALVLYYCMDKMAVRRSVSFGALHVCHRTVQVTVEMLALITRTQLTRDSSDQCPVRFRCFSFGDNHNLIRSDPP
jgi:hypothetical protein